MARPPARPAGRPRACRRTRTRAARTVKVKTSRRAARAGGPGIPASGGFRGGGRCHTGVRRVHCRQPPPDPGRSGAPGSNRTTGLSAALDGNAIALALTFRAGAAYCCGEWQCPLMLFPTRRWDKLRRVRRPPAWRSPGGWSCGSRSSSRRGRCFLLPRRSAAGPPGLTPSKGHRISGGGHRGRSPTSPPQTLPLKTECSIQVRDERLYGWDRRQPGQKRTRGRG